MFLFVFEQDAAIGDGQGQGCQGSLGTLPAFLSALHPLKIKYFLASFRNSRSANGAQDLFAQRGRVQTRTFVP
jgi:hypothetical protein